MRYMRFGLSKLRARPSCLFIVHTENRAERQHAASCESATACGAQRVYFRFLFGKDFVKRWQTLTPNGDNELRHGQWAVLWIQAYNTIVSN